jgi:hypothetical protein
MLDKSALLRYEKRLPHPFILFILPRSAWREKGGPICRNGAEGASHKLDLSPFSHKNRLE